MKFFLFSLVIVFQFNDLAQKRLEPSFDSVTPVLMKVNSLAQTKCENQAENFSVQYSAPTVLIVVKNLELIWIKRIESYKNPISAIPDQITTQRKNKKLTNYQRDKLQKLIQSSGFMNLAAEYGSSSNQRYYPYSISVCLDNQHKKVLYRSNPTFGRSPKAFRVVEDYLQQLIK